ncbi:hypothetical protein PV08_03358 [Exophiala spinifera]|uniref:Heterokaryon incompatibility domain-containing protein n=1 Tax=Exophiala spinifera TaxID=91928 RepID=A0A0D2BJJ4_9EURO|nr:uncharacterized protein PV08_03358 [Exophiala spinifera]KIW19068.1 hypothetical protein PV08_03358 [Exophiala spinifera]
MRLLKVDGHGELTRCYPEENAPAYAILSHTWGTDADEVSFQDLGDGSYLKKAGWSKIQFCRKQAEKDGLLYFWVDTCCIDKTSSAEITVAVNFMFRWYRNAVKCYVYLSDVSASEEDKDHANVAWETQFRRSRWFTRGWTLPELLAPASVEFFSREGTLLGNKRTLEGLIHEITTIPIHALRGTSLKDFPVNERLRWASGRQTKREEDEAYCLLGILGASMPLLYGEGHSRAFDRLRETIDIFPRRWRVTRENHRGPNPDQLNVQAVQHIPANDSRKDTQNEPSFTDSGYGSLPNLHYATDARVPPHDLNNSLSSDTIDDESRQDTETHYSAATSVAPAEVHNYAIELCNDIFRKIGPDLDVHQWSSLSKALPRLIKAFAIMIGFESSAPVNREIMYFIHSQNKNIATYLDTIFQGEDNGESGSDRKTTDMSLDDKMRMWESKAGTDHTDPANHDDLYTGVEELEDEPPVLTDLSLYNSIIRDSYAYKWFLTSLQTESVLQCSETQPCIMIDDIRRKIMDEFPTGRISGRRGPHAYEGQFHLRWSGKTEQRFLRKTHKQPTGSQKSYADLITITGSIEEAQLLTIREYLGQTWPGRGCRLLDVIQEAVASHDRHCSVVFADKTRLEAIIVRSYLIVTAIGPAYFVAECGEQLSWLGAALQCYNDRRLVSTCAPSLRKNQQPYQLAPFSTKTTSQVSYEILFPVSSPMSSEDSVLDKQTRWQELVGNSVLITGFPVSRRPNGYPGLEVSFETLLSLLGADEASHNHGFIMVNGRKTTLCLIKCTGNIHLWHPFHNSLNLYPSCGNGPAETYSGNFDLRRLETGRHILIICMGFQAAMVADLDYEGMPTTDYKRMLSIHETNNARFQTQITVASPPIERDSSQSLRLSQQDKVRSLGHELCSHETGSGSSNFGTMVPSTLRHPRPRFGKVQTEEQVSPSVQKYLSAVGIEPDAMAGSPDYSLDSDLISLSGSSEDPELLDLDEGANESLNIVLHRLLSGFRSSIRDCAGSEIQGVSTGSAGSTSVDGSSEAQNDSGRSQKRTRQRRADDEDPDDPEKEGPPMPPPKTLKVSNEKTRQKSLACPYLKLDPIRYRKCCVDKHSRIRDVKQHLSRRHTPLRYCQRCFDTQFEDEESLKSHVDTGTCQRQDPSVLDGLSYHQSRQLSRKSKASLNEQEQWFAIWELLFPGRLPPSSAYLNTDLSLEMCEFREYCLHLGPAFVREQIQSEQSSLPLGLNTEQQHVALERLIGHGIIALFEDWHWRVSQSASGLPGGSGLQSMPHNTSTSSIADSGVALDSQPSPRGSAN